MPQTRSQQAAEEQVAEQPVDTVEQGQEARGSKIENTEVRSEEILAMLLEQERNHENPTLHAAKTYRGNERMAATSRSRNGQCKARIR